MSAPITGQPRTSDNRGPFSWRTGIVLLAFLAIAGFFLVTEHRAHLFGALPFLLLLACPLLHVFLHRGHGAHGGGQTTSGSGGSNSRHRH